MNKIKKIIIIAAIFVLTAALIPYLIFKSRSVVLIVSEENFITYYGEDRMKTELKDISLKLFRPVKTVTVANDAGNDLAALAVTEISANPYCVLFPLRFARAAKYYIEQNPDIPVVILEGRFPENSTPSSYGIGSGESDYFIYKTDIESDFYRAAGAALVLDNGQNGRIAVFLEPNILTQARTAFLQGLNDFEKINNSETVPETLFYTNFSHYSERTDLTCVILAGIGYEFLEKKSKIPLIIFTWLNPLYTPDSTAVIIDDSPYAQVLNAVNLVVAGEKKGKIPSKFQIKNMQDFDKGTLRKLTKTW
ncbi:MAG: hypothetical protein FWB86_02230 [Treponema sp.]|nr:hypothetical protein [Treponema sp.]MCL2250979.1 hypothetical protein [Treponema sp.]